MVLSYQRARAEGWLLRNSNLLFIFINRKISNKMVILSRMFLFCISFLVSFYLFEFKIELCNNVVAFTPLDLTVSFFISEHTLITFE